MIRRIDTTKTKTGSFATSRRSLELPDLQACTVVKALRFGDTVLFVLIWPGRKYTNRRHVPRVACRAGNPAVRNISPHAEGCGAHQDRLWRLGACTRLGGDAMREQNQLAAILKAQRGRRRAGRKTTATRRAIFWGAYSDRLRLCSLLRQNRHQEW